MENKEGNINKSVVINASDDKVWQVLTTTEHVSKWAQAFLEGISVESDWTEGSVVIWKAADGTVGTKGIVEVNYAPRVLKVNYFDDPESPADAPTGDYKEHFTLLEQEGQTTLSVEAGPLSADYLDNHSGSWDKALNLIKEIAESN
ncbi:MULTISPECIES: SRPBCC family protein [Pedobacter]|uniref:SRPBCC family protein n=1 Tax=Pedobacter TaxID=84567 RepID=UPI002109BF8C|nr:MULTISPECIES: SRPBCC domain-containing protein [unclassified Pedobacter]